MRKTAVIILLMIVTACDKDPVESKPVVDYTLALDTLQNYDDYLIGDFNNKSLVSTDVFSKGYSASISNPPDSSRVQFQIAYRSLEGNTKKSTFVTFQLMESEAKLEPDRNFRYKNFPDFIDFFNRDAFQYYQRNQPVEDVPQVWIKHQNYYDIDNDVYAYVSLYYDQKITPDNFYFLVDSVNAVDSPKKKVEIYYSFKCIGVNFYGDQILLNNGKGKSTFDFN